MSSTATFTVEVVGAARIARRARAAARSARGVVHNEMVTNLAPRLGHAGAGVYPRHAPKRSGALATQIYSQVRGLTLTVISPVRSRDGYPYTGVTRVGHRAPFIYPRKAQALRFQIDGRTVFARRVRGYKPAVDWVDKAFPDAEREAALAARRIHRELTRVL